MVTILSVGFTSLSRIEHERMTSPLMCTEHAPHCATPQPYFVPVRPTCSRITQSSGVSGSTATSRTLPLMLSLAIGASLALGRRYRRGRGVATRSQIRDRAGEKRHEGDRAEILLVPAIRRDAVQAQQRLLPAARADRDDERAAGRELRLQRGRHRFG